MYQQSSTQLENNVQHAPHWQLDQLGLSHVELDKEFDRRDHLKPGDFGYRFFTSLAAINHASLYMSHHYLGDRIAFGKEVGIVRWMREESEHAWECREKESRNIYRCHYRGAYWYMRKEPRKEMIEVLGIGHVKQYSRLDRKIKIDKRLDFTQHILNRVSLRMYDLFMNECFGGGIVEWVQDIFADSLNKSFDENDSLQYDNYTFITAVNSPNCLTLVTVVEKN